MTEEERVKLAEVRRLVFTNLANGVPLQHVMVHLHLSEKEVMGHFNHVGRRVEQYRFERQQPYADCKTIKGAMKNAALVLRTLGKLGPLALTTDPRIKVVEALPFGAGKAGEAEMRLADMIARKG